jgi:hypothetical protein
MPSAEFEPATPATNPYTLDRAATEVGNQYIKAANQSLENRAEVKYLGTTLAY